MDDYHQVRLENLYVSNKFPLGSFNHPKKVMIKGVSRNSSCGVPTQILQHEITTKERVNAEKGTFVVCVLEGVLALATCPLIA